MTKIQFGRLLASLTMACALALLVPASQAQTDATPPSPARSLSCLAKPSAAPDYPEKGRLDRGSGFLRVLMKFESPDRAPKIEVLANTARQDMQDIVFRYLKQYRLPCLQPQDGVVAAVQEFKFSNSDVEPISFPDERTAEERLQFCVVTPRKDIKAPPYLVGDVVEHVVIAAIFTGDGEQPPEVKILHSSAQPGVEKMVRERVREYRMPCRTGKEQPQAMHQQFSFRPGNVSAFKLTRQSFSLMEFLSMVEGRKQLQADFDFNTMGCPFKVNYTIYGPNLPNEVRAGGPRDPNKVAFLRWLTQLQLNFTSAQQRNDLFGNTLQLDVPCGRLALAGAAS